MSPGRTGTRVKTFRSHWRVHESWMKAGRTRFRRPGETYKKQKRFVGYYISRDTLNRIRNWISSKHDGVQTVQGACLSRSTNFSISTYLYTVSRGGMITVALRLCVQTYTWKLHKAKGDWFHSRRLDARPRLSYGCIYRNPRNSPPPPPSPQARTVQRSTK